MRVYIDRSCSVVLVMSSMSTVFTLRKILNNFEMYDLIPMPSVHIYMSTSRREIDYGNYL